MIQRIQTVFLLLAITALGLFLWFPLLVLEYPQVTAPIKGWAVSQRLPFNGDVYIYFINSILTGSAIAFSFIAIFLFKKRNLQMLFCWFAVLFVVSAEAFVYYQYQTKVFSGYVILTWWNIASVVAVLFLILAFVSIRKDEELVKSLDRLR